MSRAWIIWNLCEFPKFDHFPNLILISAVENNYRSPHNHHSGWAIADFGDICRVDKYKLDRLQSLSTPLRSNQSDISNWTCGSRGLLCWNLNQRYPTTFLSTFHNFYQFALVDPHILLGKCLQGKWDNSFVQDHLERGNLGVRHISLISRLLSYC